MFKSKAKPIPMPTIVEPTANIQHDKANALVSNAISMFTTAIAQINKANEFLHDAVNKRKQEIITLNEQLSNAEKHCDDLLCEVDKNNILSEKLKAFVE